MNHALSYLAANCNWEVGSVLRPVSTLGVVPPDARVSPGSEGKRTEICGNCDGIGCVCV